MSLETLLVLLFMIFAVPGGCFLVLLGMVVRGLIRGYRIRRVYRSYRPEKSGRYV